jgi:phosphate transport system protein
MRQDRAVLDRVLAKEPMLDRLQVEIDQEAVRLITVFSPVARDLRFLLMVARITSELERIGDEAVNTCEYGAFVATPPRPASGLAHMADSVLSMVREAMQAFADEQPQQAEVVMRLDAHVDAQYAQVLRDLHAHPPEGSDAGAGSTGLVLLARSLERIADHATNVCEEVVYFVEGADIRHQTLDGPLSG